MMVKVRVKGARQCINDACVCACVRAFVRSMVMDW